jgi:two-component system chemotaxis sensor kinase CheA
MDEVMKAFLAESREGLEQVEQDVVALEKTPDDPALIAEIFRTVHTIKGTCGFLGLNRLERLTHAAEDLLALLRDGKLSYSRDLADPLLQLVDAVRAVLVLVEQTGDEGSDGHEALIARFRRLQEGSPAAEAAGCAGGEEPERGIGPADAAVRVDIAILDTLMNVVGELVLTRNQILQQVGAGSDTVLARISQRLSLITTELQEGVMRTRMQPISSIWAAFPRLVRDLELHTGKQVRLVREGGETELDRSLLQAIKDPLTHILRNAVDHGLELPAVRLACGKSEAGLLRLNAYHESGYVVIEVTDDGAGIDVAAVRERAVGHGLVRAELAEMLSEREILGLLFQAGFSTAATVTSISGRGVGLDVVRTNISRVGGTVDIQTSPRKGTTFRIKIPLTLAIVPAVIVSCHDERFAVPQINIIEVVRLDADQIRTRMESVHGCKVYRLRGKLLPLVDLRELLHIHAGEARKEIHILVLNADGREFGLVVDTVRDTEEIVVKPVGRYLKETRFYAGATIMGDGRVALILDTMAIAERASVIGADRKAALSDAATGRADAHAEELCRLLLIRMGPEATGAIPLSWVQRLEEVPASAIERSIRGEMIQYRGGILPLVRLAHLLGIPARHAGDSVEIVVHQEGDEVLGLVVDGILDVVEERAEAVRPERGAGGTLVNGLAVVQGRVTEIVDMDHVMNLSRQLLGSRREKAFAGTGHE